MTFATIFIAALAVFAIYRLMNWWSSVSRHLPPGPSRTPIVGNLFDLMRASFIRGEAPFHTFAQWAFAHGPVCYLQFLNQKVVVISDAKIAQQMCVSQSDKFSARPTGLFIARVLKGKGIVMNDGPSWKEHRNFITQEFRKFGFGHHSLEQRIQYVVDEYIQQIGKLDGKAHDPHLDLAVATYNVIWTVISGDQFKWDDPFLRGLIHNLETNLQAVELVGVHNYVTIFSVFHLLWHNPFRLIDIIRTRFGYFENLIRSSKTNDQAESMIKDYLVKLESTSASNEATTFSESQLLWLVSDLFIAGGETTITTLRWSLLCLGSYPDIQERIRQELRDNIGLAISPTYAQRAQLPYFEAFVHEVLRFCGVTPGMWRNTSKDAVVEGYDIPKDTWILLHFWAMSNNSQWEDGQEFRPERFLNEDGTFRKHDHLLAFSAGKRQCPGETLARTELFLFLSNVVRKYHVLLPNDKKVDIGKGTFGVTYTPPEFQVIFRPLDDE